MKKILVTGGAGYVGTVLIEKLLQEGYQVICLDRFFFGFESISQFTSNPYFSYIQDDIRWFDKNYLKDVDCVIDLASISNDPAGELDPTKTTEINFKGRERVAKLSKTMGVKKYFLASTCSIYGFNKNICDEDSKINPLTTYAKASAMAENEILCTGDDDFCCTAFRFATIYGLSKRMRFDLVVNTMTLSLFQNKTIIVNGGGTQKRPLVDVRDAAEAYILGINADTNVINGKIFNVGSNEQNYTMIDLAKEVGSTTGIDFEIISKGDPDFRSYDVDFSKIKNTFSFIPKFSPFTSALEVFNALKNNIVSYDLKTKTVDWYKFLIKKENIDKRILIDNKIF